MMRRRETPTLFFPVHDIHTGSSLYLDRYAARRAVRNQRRLRLLARANGEDGGAAGRGRSVNTDYASSMPMHQCQTPCKC